MEIISKGELPGDKICRGNCHNCKSVIQAKASELEYYSDQREGDWYTGKCPVCHKSMNFYPKGR